jgi:hypothetical protein
MRGNFSLLFNCWGSTADSEQVHANVTGANSFGFPKMFHSILWPLIGHRPRQHLHDDRLELFLGYCTNTTEDSHGGTGC